MIVCGLNNYYYRTDWLSFFAYFELQICEYSHPLKRKESGLKLITLEYF